MPDQDSPSLCAFLSCCWPRSGSESRPTLPSLPLGAGYRRGSPHAIGKARAPRPRTAILVDSPFASKTAAGSAEQRGECILQTFHGYMRLLFRSRCIQCIADVQVTDIKYRVTLPHQNPGNKAEQNNWHEETKATAPAMQSGQRTRPRLPGRLFNFHIPLPVRSASATPAGIARRGPKQKITCILPPSNHAKPPVHYIQ